MLKNSSDTYGLVSRAFHWAIALLILCLIPVGFWMEGLPYSPFKGSVYGLHKALGITVLVLALARVVWSVLLNPKPAPLQTHTPLERHLAHAIHILLYIGMIGMPISGWVMSAAGDHPVSFFGLFNLPAIVPKDENVFEIAKEVHELAGYALLAAVGLHFAGALKHHFIDRDATLRRMGGNMIVAGIGVALLMASGGVLAQKLFFKSQEVAVEQVAAAPAEAPVAESAAPLWAIDKPASRIGFAFSQYNQSVEGAFSDFDGVIRFDPANLSASLADIRIRTASIGTGDASRDEQARGAEWFASSAFPDIHFLSKSFTHEGDNRYSAAGTLTIRDMSKDITLPFTLNIEGSRALMSAELPLSRLDFGVGQGQWAATDAIGADVKVTISLAASKP